MLYDPATKTIYTPNTDKTGTMQGAAEMLPDNGEESRAFQESDHPREEDGKFSPKEGMPTWNKREAKEPFNYFELSGRDSNFPTRWVPKGFSHESTSGEHAKNHMASVGASGEEEYVKMAKAFLTSPRGKHGDAFVRKNGDVCRYDYDTKLFATATRDGIIKTFWNLKQDRGNEGADVYWEKQKRKG